MSSGIPGQRKILTNAVANWVGLAATLGVAFYLAPVVVHALGPGLNGVWTLFAAVLAWLTLLDLGVAASLVRYTAKYRTVEDRDSLNRIFSTSLCIFAAAGSLALALVVAVVAGVEAGVRCDVVGNPDGFLPGLTPEVWGEARWALLLLGLNLALSLPLSVFPSMLYGLGRYPTRTAITVGCLALRVVLVLTLVGGEHALVRLAVVETVCKVVEQAALAVVLWRCLPGLRFSLRLADRATLRSIGGYSFDAAVAMLAGRVSFSTDAMVINAFHPPAYATFFGIGAGLVENAKNALRSATTVLTPAVSELEAKKDSGAIRRVFLEGSRWALWLILPVQVGLLVLGRPFLVLWMGRELADASYPTLLILAVPLGLIAPQSIAARVLYGVGNLRWFSRLLVAEAVANLLLSVALAVPLKIEGVALGTALPNLICNVAVLVFVCREVRVGTWDYVRRAFTGPVVLAALLAVGWLLTAPLAYPAGWDGDRPPAVGLLEKLANWGGFLGVCGIGTGVYGVCAVLVEFGPAELWRRFRSAGRALSGMLPATRPPVAVVTGTEGSAG
jgi:O-antigen/teichoic acid export membrane protein